MGKKYNRGVHALIQLDGTNTFLLIKRSAYKENNALHRDLPGGGVEKGEDLIETLLREYSEEIGVVLDNSELESIKKLGEVNVTSGGIITYFHTTSKQNQIILSHEHTHYQRLTLDEALQLNPRRKIIDEAITLYHAS